MAGMSGLDLIGIEYAGSSESEEEIEQEEEPEESPEEVPEEWPEQVPGDEPEEELEDGPEEELEERPEEVTEEWSEQVPEDEPEEVQKNPDEMGLTKKPLTKRQRAHIQYVEHRKAERTVIFTDCSCRFKCPNIISKNRRMEINTTYWNMPPSFQRDFILQHTSREDVKRRRVEADISGHGYKRSCRLTYKLPDENFNTSIVCNLFFLNTLGYKKNCNNFIYRAYAAVDKNLSLEAEEPKVIKPNPLEAAVRGHILSYHPTISHYRREHAPDALYLPADLTCTLMHGEFKQSREEESLESCSYSYYNKIVKGMNIRFTKLGHELCEVCREAERHISESGHRKQHEDERQFRESLPVAKEFSEPCSDPESEPEPEPHDAGHEADNGDEADEEMSCEKCSAWLKHREASISSRQEYEKDKLYADGLAVSVDLQKVVQLPRIKCFKQVIFAKRIVAMNETFAPLGGGTNGQVHAVLWNETISGRKAPDLASAFQTHLQANASIDRITYWLDNCSSQNKNWDLFIHMILFINSDLTHTTEIIFKYLEPGHTFMSADAFHAAVERSMKKQDKGEIHTFDDFVRSVQNANVATPAKVTVMKPSDFFTPTIQLKPSVLTKIKPRPHLNEIKMIRFKQGSLNFTFKTCFSGEYKSVSIFTKTQLKSVMQPTFSLLKTLTFNSSDRGIEKARKDLIIKKLCPLMPEEKRKYWIDLHVNDDIDDF